MLISCMLPSCCVTVPPPTGAKVGFWWTVTVWLTSSDVTVSPSSWKLIVIVSVVVPEGVAGEGQVMAVSIGGCWIMHVDCMSVRGEGRGVNARGRMNGNGEE